MNVPFPRIGSVIVNLIWFNYCNFFVFYPIVFFTNVNRLVGENEEENNSGGENVVNKGQTNGQDEMTSSTRRPIKITLFKNGDPWSGGYTFFFSPTSLVT
jgi:hypothetical protein